MDPRALLPRLLTAWSAATSSRWTAACPAAGQCGVTALVVQDLCGGEIRRTRSPGGTHFYNMVAGRRVDLTESQFAAPLAYDDHPASRAEAMADTSPAQYAALRAALGLPA